MKSESRVRKRKMARPKNEIAIIKSKPMNQVVCQNGKLRSDLDDDSRYTIRVGAEICWAEFEEDDDPEADFLRERFCCCCWLPEGATVEALRKSELQSQAPILGRS